jgi:type III restriction enzyme
VYHFDYLSINWDFSNELKESKEQFYRITLDSETKTKEASADLVESQNSVQSWLVATSNEFEWFSSKQIRFIIDQVITKLRFNPSEISLIKFHLREKIAGFIQEQTDIMACNVFEKLFKNQNLCFYLECIEGRFEIPSKIIINATKKLRHENDDDVQLSLFDYVANDMNEYEKSIALFLDKHPQVLWWYRNLVGPSNFSIQGYRRNLIYPDFVVHQGDHTQLKSYASVVVLESKGKHLKGSEDTNYKRHIAKIFNHLGKEVTWQDLGEGFDKHVFRFQVLDEGEYADKDWRDELKKILTQHII